MAYTSRALDGTKDDLSERDAAFGSEAARRVRRSKTLFSFKLKSLKAGNEAVSILWPATEARRFVLAESSAADSIPEALGARICIPADRL